MNNRMLSMVTKTAMIFSLAGLLWSLCGYLSQLYCGCWFWAGVNLVTCVIYCSTLLVLEQQRQLQRALDEVERTQRECLAFLLQLPGQIYFEIRRSRGANPWI